MGWILIYCKENMITMCWCMTCYSDLLCCIKVIMHISDIPAVQFLNGIIRITQSQSYMLSLTESVWDFQKMHCEILINMPYWEVYGTVIHIQAAMKEELIGMERTNSTVKWSTIVCISVVNLSLLLSTIAIGTYISADVNHVCTCTT